jgi:hypothetical protein
VRRMMTITAVVAAMLAAAACGSSAPKANKADVEAVVASVSAGSSMTRKQATCIANAAVPKLSKKGLKEAKKKSSDLKKLSKTDQAAIFDSFSSCVTVAQLSPIIAKEFQSGAGKIASKDEKCYVKALSSHYKNSGDLMRAVITDTAKFAGSLSKCVSSDAIKQSLIEAMTSGGGMTTAQATCAADKILSEVSVSDLERAGSSSKLPADIQSKIEAATAACASAS